MAAVAKYLKGLEARLAALEGKAGISAPAAAGAGGESDEEVDTPEWLEAYDTLLSTELAAFSAQSDAVGGKVAQLGAGLAKVFTTVRSILALTLTCKKPTPTELFAADIGKALQAAVKEVDSVNPGLDFNNHFKAVSEAVPANNWILLDTLPHQHVEGQKDAAEFWLNKVRVAFRSEGGAHMDWCAALMALLEALRVFVKKHFKTGLWWKAGGKAVGAAGGAAAGGAAAAPAPAPKKAKGGAEDGARKVAAAAAGLAAELGKLDTSGLRKVTKDMKAKNMKDKPTLKPKKKPAAGAAAGAGRAKKAAVTKPPRLELVGKRWFCEYQTDTVEIEITAKSQEVYIYGCNGATVVLKNKCNALQVDKCTKTNVLFDAVISGASLVDCKRCLVQVKQHCKSFVIDKTDGATVFLNFASRDAEITASKSSELNLSFPDSDSEDAEWLEAPIPEQFVSQLDASGSLHTKVSELYSEQ